MSELRCTRLAKSYGDQAVLTDVDLTVPAGTLTAILGASGSGKTTLLRLITGLTQADAGTIQIGGTLVANGTQTHIPASKRGIGYVAQEGALFPHLDVAGNIGFALRRRERKTGRRVTEMLALVGLDKRYLGRRPHELSGGEQRRVALARALAPQPRLLLLDEPFTGLDTALRSETRDAVLDALTQKNATSILVTHDQPEALSLGNHVAVLRHGNLIQTAAPTTLYQLPIDLDLARFLGDTVTLPGHAQPGRVDCVLGRLPTHGPPALGPVDVMIRPEQIQLQPATPNGGAPTAMGTVRHVQYRGAHATVTVELKDLKRTRLTATTPGHDTPAPGSPVHATIHGPVAVYPSTNPDYRASFTEEAPIDSRARA